MYERYEKWGYPCLYTTKKNECTKGTKSGGTLVYILLKKKNYERYKKWGCTLVYILLKLITKNGQVLVKLQCAV